MVDAKFIDALRKYFSHDKFRSPQDEIIESIVSGRDTLAIMPTGGGKSLCYQLPAMLLDGVTLVVSPLIALMKDQVDALVSKGIPAGMINSSQTWQEQLAVLDALSKGELKLAYVAPERFRTQSFMRVLSSIKVGLFAVDEAHCISQWGHDFRPDYMRLGETLEKLGRPVCAAFTATATPEVKQDILRQLNMREASIFVSGFARKNLSFNVREVSSKAEKFSRICELIDKYKTGIIYCATRKSVEALSESLWKDGIRHITYHGAMSPSERDSAQEKFIGKREDIAVATNAFGMGIDRPDIRFVCHYELTGSIEALYQESGRAGRDGNESYCEMLLMYADKRVQEFFIEGANPEANFIRNVYRIIRENSDNSYECFMPIDSIAEEVADYARYVERSSPKFRKRKFGGNGANSMAVSSAISILRRFGYIERFDVAGARVRGARLLNPDVSADDIEIPRELLDEKRKRDENKLRDVVRYAYSKECRQKWILNYFGESLSTTCGKCDVCSDFKDIQMTFSQISDDELIEVRKALSGVARMSVRIGTREWQPRFGREKIVKCLAGSRDEKLLSSGCDKLSTYGILKTHGAKFCSELFSAMIDAELVEILDGDYPLVAITEKGVSVMLDEVSSLAMNYPRYTSKLFAKKNSSKDEEKNTRKKNRKLLPQEDVAECDKSLYNALSELRRTMSTSLGGIPAFKIFSNAVLRELARLRPTTVESAMEIKGIGEINSKKYLNRFIEMIKNYYD